MALSDDIDGGDFELAAIELAASRPSFKPAFATVERPSESSLVVTSLAATGVALGAAFAAAPVSVAAAEAASGAGKTSSREGASADAGGNGPIGADPADGDVSAQPAFVILEELDDATMSQAPRSDLTPPIVTPLEAPSLNSDIGSAFVAPVAPAVSPTTPAATNVGSSAPAGTSLSLASMNDLFAARASAVQSVSEAAGDDASAGFAMAELLAGRFGVKMQALRASLEERLDAFAFSDVAQEGPVDDAPLDPFMDALDPYWAAMLAESGELAGFMVHDDATLAATDGGLIAPSLHDTLDGFLV